MALISNCVVSGISYPAGGDVGPTPSHDAFKTLGGDAGLTYPEGFTDTRNHYMLEADSSGDIVIEPGPDTRVYYFTRETSGWTKAEIASAEGVSVGTIDDAWLNAQSEYGFRSDRALDFDDWSYSPLESWLASNPRASYHLMLERGNDYTADNIPTNSDDYCGQSALHPSYIGAFGTGTPPVVNSQSWAGGGGQGPRYNIVFGAITFDGSNFAADGGNFSKFDDLMFAGTLLSVQSDVASPLSAYGVQWNVLSGTGLGLTFYGVKVLDCWLNQPASGSLPWNTGENDRISGVYVSNSNGLLIMDSYADHNGWEDGYGDNNDPEHPPSVYSHNFYLQSDNKNVTVRNVITSRAAMSGFQFRTGGAMWNVLSSENNGFHNIGEINYTVEYGSMHIGAAIKDSDVSTVAYAQGWAVDAGSSLVDWSIRKSIIANFSNPNDSAEVTAKAVTLNNGVISHVGDADAHFDDTIQFNYRDNSDANAGSITSTDQDAMTFSRWLDNEQSVSAGTNTTDDFLTFLRSEDKPWNHIKGIQQYMWDLAGVSFSTRSASDDITFTPWTAGDGYNWHNPENWTSSDIPGVDVVNDNVNLNGQTVVSFEPKCALGELNLGTSGTLYISGGKTTCTTLAGTGIINLSRAGQVHASTATGAVTVNVDGGRFAVTGALSGIDVTVNEDLYHVPELLILSGGALTISSGKTLTLDGDDLRCIFDGDDAGSASITIQGTLAFVAGSSGFGRIQVDRSGHFGLDANGSPNEPSVTGSVVLASGSTVTVDTTGLATGTYILAENVTDNGATLPSGVTVNGSNELQVVV